MQAAVPLREWRLRLLAWTLLLLLRPALRLAGFRRLERLFKPHELAPPPAFARRVVAAVEWAARFSPGSTCLTQACTARAILASRGFAVTIRVGVRTGNNVPFEAHAWLLSGTDVILGARVGEFHEFRRIADFG